MFKSEGGEIEGLLLPLLRCNIFSIQTENVALHRKIILKSVCIKKISFLVYRYHLIQIPNLHEKTIK